MVEFWFNFACNIFPTIFAFTLIDDFYRLMHIKCLFGLSLECIFGSDKLRHLVEECANSVVKN